MRTKRSTRSTKATTRTASTASRTKVAAPSSGAKTKWVAGFDAMSLGIAGVAILAAAVLVSAYKPARSDEHHAQSLTSDAGPADSASSDAGHTTTPPPGAATAVETSSSTWPAPMTITGCLDRDGEAFRLTDAAGIGVPKARSWKSGFLKKNASAVTLVDGERHSRLANHLGQRVSVTGTMVNRQMQIGTLRLLSETCSEKTKI